MRKRSKNVRSLGEAHRGYRYQDVMTAYFMALVLLRQSGTLLVDTKLIPDDLFDDLTAKLDGRTVRRQFKHSREERQLTTDDFTREGSGVRLRDLITSFVSLQPEHAADEYRLCVTWTYDLAEWPDGLLVEADVPPTIEGSSSQLLRLNLEVLWPPDGTSLWEGLDSLARADVAAFCERFVIEASCPRKDGSQTDPQNRLAQLLAHRVGIGTYPNDHRDADSAASILAERAQDARIGHETLTLGDVEEALKLRRDYGRVSQQFPVIPGNFISREPQVGELAGLAEGNGTTIIQGPPGSGKSWLLDPLKDRLRAHGNLVATHYCYLEPGDRDEARRITTEVMIASLLADLVDQVPELRTSGSRPYAAGLEDLVNALPKAVAHARSGRVFLVVDGLDHIARVIKSTGSVTEEEADIVERLASLQLPEGVSLVFGSQPGPHLESLASDSTVVFEVLPWSDAEVVRLWDLIGLGQELEDAPFETETARLSLLERASGNPLVATYIARHVINLAEQGAALASEDLALASDLFAGGLGEYYGHLLSTADSGTNLIANLLGVIDFSLGRRDLEEILPPMVRPLIDSAVASLRPVLKDVSGQGGFGIYHESFRRHIIEAVELSGQPMRDVILPVADWLRAKGFFSDAKAYRFLLPLLRRAGDHDEVVRMVGPEFVVDSVAAFHPKPAVSSNLNVAAMSAAHLRDLSALGRIAQLISSAYTCYEHNIDFEQSGRTYGRLEGFAAVAERMLFEGRPTLSPTQGLELCRVVSDNGASAPWAEYTELAEAEKERKVAMQLLICEGMVVRDGTERISKRVARALNKYGNRSDTFCNGLIGIVHKHGGVAALERLRMELRVPSRARSHLLWKLSIAYADAGSTQQAEATAALPVLADLSAEDVTELVRRRLLPAGQLPEAVPPESFDIMPGPQRYSVDRVQVQGWLNSVARLAVTFPDALVQERSRLAGETRYLEWLRFAIDVSLAEALEHVDPAGAAELARAAVAELDTDTHPFEGRPRAMDLYEIHGLYQETVRKALRLCAGHDGFAETLGSLRSVANGVTAYLQGSGSGPLTRESLAVLLAPYHDRAGCTDHAVEHLQEQARKSSAMGEFYDVQAFHQLSLADALAAAGRVEEARAAWRNGARFLAAYGNRKDSTLYEPLESMAFLLDDDLEFVRLGASRIRPLVRAATSHTDGKGTNHLTNAWFELLSRADPVSAGILLGDSLERYGGHHDRRNEKATSDLAGRALEGSPLLRSYLFSGVPFEGKHSDGRERIELLELMSSVAPEMADDYCIRLASELQDDASENYPAVLTAFSEAAAKAGLRPPALDLVPANDDEVPGAAYEDEPLDFGSFPAGGTVMDLMSWIKRHSHGLSRKGQELDQLAGLIAAEANRLATEGRLGDCSKLLRFAAQSWYYSSRPSLMSLVAPALQFDGHLEMACLAWVLAFTRTRGGRGWHSMGCEEEVGFFSEAYTLFPEKALDMLCGEVASHLAAEHTPGICQSLVLVALRHLGPDRAEEVLDEVLKVIELRLPLGEEFEQELIFREYEGNPPEGVSVNEALAFCLSARISHPEFVRKRAAFAGLADAVCSSPEACTFGIRRTLAGDAPFTSKILVLRILLHFEPNGYPISSALTSELEALASDEGLQIAWTAHLLLKRLGAPASEPPNRGFVIEAVEMPRGKARWIVQNDSQARVERVGCVIDSFAERVATKYDALWESDLELNKARATERYEDAFSRGGASYPATPWLHWFLEVFERALDLQASELPDVLSEDSLWDDEEIEETLQMLGPETDLTVRWYGSRVPRPRVPRPTELAETELPSQSDDPGFEGWKRVGFFEEEIVPGESYTTEPQRYVRTWAAAVAGSDASFAQGRPPFRDGVSDDWLPLPSGMNAAGQATGQCIAFDRKRDVLGDRDFMYLIEPLLTDLGLSTEAGRRLALVDEDGASVVVFRRWHRRPVSTDYEHGLTPRVHGCEILMEPRFYESWSSHFAQGTVFVVHTDSQEIPHRSDD